MDWNQKLLKLCSSSHCLGTILGILLLVLVSPAAQADGKGSQFGLLYGLSVPDAQNTNPFRMFGVKGEAFLLPTFSAGGYYLQSDKSGQQSVANKFSYSLTGIETAYHLPSASGDTYIALRIGVTKLLATSGGNDLIFSPYHYGLATGYDFYIGEYLSLGFEGSYLHAQPGRTQNSSGIEFNEPSFNILSFLVSLQFHL